MTPIIVCYTLCIHCLCSFRGVKRVFPDIIHMCSGDRLYADELVQSHLFKLTIESPCSRSDALHTCTVLPYRVWKHYKIQYINTLNAFFSILSQIAMYSMQMYMHGMEPVFFAMALSFLRFTLRQQCPLKSYVMYLGDCS